MSAVEGLSNISVNYFRWELYIVVILVLLACVSLLYATYKYNSDPMDEVSALVVQQSCTSGCRSSSCATRVTYTYKRRKYVSDITLSYPALRGSVVTLYINPEQPDTLYQYSYGNVSNNSSAILLALLLLVALSYLTYYLVQQNKGLAGFFLLSRFM